MMKKFLRNEQGAIVLEATYTIFFAIVILVFFLSYGFILYQRTMVAVSANQIAEEVAQSYKFRDAANGEVVTQDMIESMGRFRYMLNFWEYESKNEAKAKNLIEPRVSATSLAKDAGGLTVDITTDLGDIGRRHYVVKVTKKYNFMFDQFMNSIFSKGGDNNYNQIEATAVVESMDASHYINNVKLAKWGVEKLASPLGFVGSIASVVNAVCTLLGIPK